VILSQKNQHCDNHQQQLAAAVGVWQCALCAHCSVTCWLAEMHDKDAQMPHLNLQHCYRCLQVMVNQFDHRWKKYVSSHGWETSNSHEHQAIEIHPQKEHRPCGFNRCICHCQQTSRRVSSQAAHTSWSTICLFEIHSPKSEDFHCSIDQNKWSLIG
jgi:hypothetical protein